MKQQFVRSFLRPPWDDVLAGMEPLMRVRAPLKSLLPTLVMMVVTWFLYVPVHELLHVVGCVGTGGTVTELEIKPLYGGRILERVFPFVVAKGSYGGRLTGFDTHGCDLIYLATDFMPFLLSVLIGVPLLVICTRRKRPWLLGPAVVLGLASFYNIPGDYFEMSSILTTRVATILHDVVDQPADQGDLSKPDSPAHRQATEDTPKDSHDRIPAHTPLFAGIRSDDVFALLGDVITKPADRGLHGAGEIALGILLIVISIPLAVLLAFFTYWLGGRWARLTVGAPRPPFGKVITRRGANRKPMPSRSTRG